MNIDWTIVISVALGLVVLDFIGLALVGSMWGIMAVFGLIGKLGAAFMGRVWGIDEDRPDDDRG